MEWPAYSPDLNPIEPVWDMLGRREAERISPPSTLNQLKNALVVEWSKILQEAIDSLKMRMNHR